MKSMMLAVMALAFATGAVAQNVAARTLDIYFIDVEGGQATLLVTPQGEALLIDTGFPAGSSSGVAATSHASRIAAAARDAGVKQIDL